MLPLPDYLALFSSAHSILLPTYPLSPLLVFKLSAQDTFPLLIQRFSFLPLLVFPCSFCERKEMDLARVMEGHTNRAQAVIPLTALEKKQLRPSFFVEIRNLARLQSKAHHLNVIILVHMSRFRWMFRTNSFEEFVILISPGEHQNSAQNNHAFIFNTSRAV